MGVLADDKKLEEANSILSFDEAKDDGDQEIKEAETWISSIVTKIDDPSTPAFTFRTVLLGVIWSVFMATANSIFSFRTVSFLVPTQLVLLLSYPMGFFLAAVLPRVDIFGIALNPGPFSIKEHALIYVIAGAAGGVPYGIDNVVVQKWDLFMKDSSINFWNSLPWILSTQFIGYGIAGVSRRYLVKPAKMIWPTVLPTVALINSFHGQEGDTNNQKYTMSRYSFFWIVFVIGFLYELIPLYFAPLIAAIPLVCLFTNNRTAKFLGSFQYGNGVGLFAISLDWSTINVWNPLYMPFWAGCNLFISMILFTWVLPPIVQYSDPFKVGGTTGLGYNILSDSYWLGDNSTADNLIPVMNNAHIYDKTGMRRFVAQKDLLNDYDYQLNQTTYENSKPFYLTSLFSLAYFNSFLSIAAVFSHVLLWHGKSVYKQFKDALKQLKNDDEDDLNVMMRSYTDVPDWFYLAFLVVFTSIQVLNGLLTSYKMPWWSSLLAVFLGSVYVIPIGIIFAISGFQMYLNVLTEFLIGLLTPGDTIGVMCFKSLGYNLNTQALALLADLKIGHYLHISPLYMFASQMIGTLIGAVLNLAVGLWAENGLDNLFKSNSQGWNPDATYGTFLSAGGIWGSIGPARFFGFDSPYSSLLWGFAIGLILPFLPWLMDKYYPHRFWKLINFPILLGGNPASPTTQVTIVMPFLINFIFNKLIFTYRQEWWKKYTFILGIGLDSSTALVVLFTSLLSFIGPEFATSGVGPFTPVQGGDYYCFETYYNGTYKL